MLMQILTHTPVFVWALLAALLAMGLTQTRTRHVGLGRVLALPALFLGLGLWSLVPGMSAQPVVAALWLAALALGAAAGRRTPQTPGTIWLAAEQRFVLPGSWIPLAFIGVIFSLRYCSSVAMALHPEWRASLALQVPLSVTLGLLTGLSVGRTLDLLRLRRPAPADAALAPAATTVAHA